MSEPQQCPKCHAAVRAGDRFCGLCFAKLSVADGAPAEEPRADETSAAGAVSFDPREAWAPSGARPAFHDVQAQGLAPRSFEDDAGGVTAALDHWKRAISWTERWRMRKPRPAAELGAAAAFFAGGVLPPQLAAWFSWWDGQSDSGCWLPGTALRALPLGEALGRRKLLLGLGEEWAALARFAAWLPLIESAGGDVALYAQAKAGSGLCWINHENPLEVLDEWGPALECAPLSEAIAEAAVLWRAR